VAIIRSAEGALVQLRRIHSAVQARAPNAGLDPQPEVGQRPLTEPRLRVTHVKLQPGMRGLGDERMMRSDRFASREHEVMPQISRSKKPPEEFAPRNYGAARAHHQAVA